MNETFSQSYESTNNTLDSKLERQLLKFKEQEWILENLSDDMTVKIIEKIDEIIDNPTLPEKKKNALLICKESLLASRNTENKDLPKWIQKIINADNASIASWSKKKRELFKKHLENYKKNNPNLSSVESDELAKATKNLSREKIKEVLYLSKHRSLSDTQYKKLFPKRRLWQWAIWDCYLISTFHALKEHQTFDTLIKSSLLRNEDWKRHVKIKGKDWIKRRRNFEYAIRMPLWEPKAPYVFITKEEMNLAKVRGDTWFKILEVAYAKFIQWWRNKYPGELSSQEFQQLNWWNNLKALKNMLWKNNINWEEYSYITWISMAEHKYLQTIVSNKNLSKDEHRKFLNRCPTISLFNTMKKNKNQSKKIINALKNYNIKEWKSVIQVSSFPWPSDALSYNVWWNKLYHSHSYTVTKVTKDTSWKIKNIYVKNPRNSKWEWKNTIIMNLKQFASAFCKVTIWTMNNQYLDWETNHWDTVVTRWMSNKNNTSPKISTVLDSKK